MSCTRGSRLRCSVYGRLAPASKVATRTLVGRFWRRRKNRRDGLGRESLLNVTNYQTVLCYYIWVYWRPPLFRLLWTVTVSSKFRSRCIDDRPRAHRTLTRHRLLTNRSLVNVKKFEFKGLQTSRTRVIAISWSLVRHTKSGSDLIKTVLLTFFYCRQDKRENVLSNEPWVGLGGKT